MPVAGAGRALDTCKPRDAFKHESDWVVPPPFALRLPGGKAVGEYGAVITADNQLLFDVSPYFSLSSPRGHPVYRRLRLPPARRFESATVLTTRGAANYYHFLLDVIPRLFVLRAAGVDGKAEIYYVPYEKHFQRELLDRFGMGGKCLVSPAAEKCVSADSLVIPSLAAPPRQTPAWVIQTLAGAFADLPTGGSGRIYVSRGHEPRTRIVKNERAVLEVLGDCGFRTVTLDGLKVADQAALFRDAEVIVAAHGAGLANLVFCRPGVKLIELFSPAYVNVVFWKLLSQIPDARYGYVIGTGRAPVEAVAADMVINLEDLRRVLGRLGVSRPKCGVSLNTG
jgi:capsular polysaccharide biosynthesis protein